MKTDSVVRRKLARIRRGGRPRVLDLFAGCGGLSLGFEAAGFQPAAAVELDPDAAASHGRNFHGADARHAEARDITKLSPEALSEGLGLGAVESAIKHEITAFFQNENSEPKPKQRIQRVLRVGRSTPKGVPASW